MYDFQIHHMDYPNRGFTKLKYSDALSPIIRSGLKLSNTLLMNNNLFYAPTTIGLAQ